MSNLSLEMTMLDYLEWADPGLFWRPVGPETELKRMGNYQINYQTWTQLLRQLESQGLAEKFIKKYPQTAGFKSRTYYRVTPKGRQLVRELRGWRKNS